MSRPGTPDCPLRVAIVGSGPAGFYAVQALRAADLESRIDMFDRLPAPFGLVRYGVAPDHQKIKSVTAVYDKLAQGPGFRFFGGVDYGRDLSLDDLRDHYHQVVFSTGAQTDRSLGIPGEDLEGSHPATEFVAWYNGHPDFVDRTFDLSHERAVVVGVGNVAVDVARVLCRTPEELARTDIADYALAALRKSRVREVLLLGRRGPAQAAFTNPEVKELGELEDAAAVTLADEVRLDEATAKAIEGDRGTIRKVQILESYVDRDEPGKSKRLVLRFLTSPVEIEGASGRVAAVKLVRNELFTTDSGAVRSRATDRFETVEAGLVFRSVGYRGVPLAGVPFREDWGVVPNDAGRVLERPDGPAVEGLYVSGWIKRGPSGVIGTNKPDAAETVRAMLEDVESGRHFQPGADPAAIPGLLGERGVRFVSYDDWRRLDRIEIDRGQSAQRPRVKLVTFDQVWQALA